MKEKKSTFGWIFSFAGQKKSGYIASVILAVIGAAVLLLIVGCIGVVVIMNKKIKAQKEDSDTIPGSPEIR